MKIGQRDEAAAASSAGGSVSEAASSSPQVEDNTVTLLPRYLSPLVEHYHGDFYMSLSFDPKLILQLMAEGFLPISNRRCLLPKLHEERCVIRLPKLHVSKSTRKKSKRFLFSINESFDDVVAGCHAQHGINWLYPPIVSAFRSLHRRTVETNGRGSNALLFNEGSKDACGSTPVRLYSVEVWNKESGELVGGELGYSVGGIYTSMTGFSNQDGAGSVQLAALGKVLTHCGFEIWDLGMEMDYKRKLGAELMPRHDFVREVRRTRVQNPNLILQCTGRRNTKEIIDKNHPPADISSDTLHRCNASTHEHSQQVGQEQSRSVTTEEEYADISVSQSRKRSFCCSSAYHQLKKRSKTV